MKSIGGWGRIFPDRPDDALIIGAQEFVKDRLSLKWMPMFLASEQFVEMIRPSRQMVDAAEAVLLAKQRRNQRLMKVSLLIMFVLRVLQCVCSSFYCQLTDDNT